MHLLCAELQRVGPSLWNCPYNLKIHFTHEDTKPWVSSICVSCLKHSRDLNEEEASRMIREKR